MDFPSFTMHYLESLSTGELAELADRNGLDIPPGLERVFIIGELLELERYDRRNGEVDDAGLSMPSGEFIMPTALPDQYGMSYIDVLIRDPLWVFVFWEVKKQGRNSQGGDAGPNEYCLRIVPLKGDEMRADIDASFTVAVGMDDRSLYLGIPHDAGRCFRVDLCARSGDGCAALAVSRPFRLPWLVGPKSYGQIPNDAREREMQAVYRNPLSELSGAGRFPLVRSVDRLPRDKGS